ncbi:MAG: TonB-dependent receptor [Candidatus Eremiobacteraeota bacterium]|nr:TonB-dependent receptor [Candidatus Eremiobacteraeota bacterium]
MRHALVFSAAVLVALVCAGPAAGASATPSPQPASSATPKPLPPVVVTAQRHPTSIDTTSRQVYIVSPADLERIGSLTAAGALRFVPGTVVQEYGPYGSLGTVALRGASASQTLVLIDGQPANETDTGSFDLSSLPVSVIDHIEIVQGGSSTLYGSAAMGGVVNIITKYPVSAGNLNMFAQLGYQGTFTRGLGFTLGGPDMLARVDVQAVSASNGFAYPAFRRLYPAGIRTNSDAKTSDAGIALSGRLGAVAVKASFHNDTSAIGIPGSVFFASNLAQQQRVYQRMNLDFDLPLAHGDVALQVASNGRRLHFFDTTQPFPYDNQANGNTHGVSLRTTLALGRFNVVTGGYDSGGSSVTFDTAYVNPNSPVPQACQGGSSFDSCIAHDASSAWYLQDEIHAPGTPLTVSLGIRTQRTQGARPVSVPSIGTVVRLSDSIDVLANYARAFRTPNLDERYYPGYGSPALQPEYGATYDVGMRCHATRSECTLSYFGQDTSNLIINVPIDAFGDVQPFNVSRARVRGLETSIDTRVGTFAHAYLAYTDFLRAADLTPSNQSSIRLLYRPTSTGALAVWISRGTWTYGIDSTYVGRRYADEKNTQVLTPYVVTGLHLKKTLSRRLMLTMRVDNIGNNHNAEDVLGYPIVGSAFSVRLSTR